MRNFLRFAKHFAARSLIKTRANSRFPNGFENPDGADTGDVGGVLGNIEADANVALRGEMINFVRFQFVKQLHQVNRITQVAEVQKHADTIDVRIGVKMIDARSVEGAGAPDDAVDFVVFLEQEIGQVTSVLPGNAGDQCSFHAEALALKQSVCASNSINIPEARP